MAAIVNITLRTPTSFRMHRLRVSSATPRATTTTTVARSHATMDRPQEAVLTATSGASAGATRVTLWKSLVAEIGSAFLSRRTSMSRRGAGKMTTRGGAELFGPLRTEASRSDCERGKAERMTSRAGRYLHPMHRRHAQRAATFCTTAKPQPEPEA